MIEKSEWDSNFFGLIIGKIQIEKSSTELFEQTLEQKREQFDLLYLFLNTPPDETCTAWLKNNGGKLVDIKVTYARDVLAQSVPELPIIEYSGEITPALIQLSIASGHSSRFGIDPRLNHKFEELYTTWMQKSIDRTLADNMFVYIYEGEICGFVTIKIKEDAGQMGIMAVDNKIRGKGIGKAFVNSCDRWLGEMGVKRHQVVTQKQNKGACA